jgi:hypothetical protein
VVFSVRNSYPAVRWLRWTTRLRERSAYSSDCRCGLWGVQPILAWFEFGDRRTVKSLRNGAEKQVGDYALHVQCAWRITQRDDIVTGRGDIFCAPTETSEPMAPDFDWEKGNRFDRIVEQLSRMSRANFTS